MTKSYEEAGVNINLANQIVKQIKPLVKKTFTSGVMSDIGSFGGLFSLAGEKCEEPVLVSGTDGVGTKLKIAFNLDKHDTVGIDLVAMSVNDIITCGAKPLFFLDYISTGKLEKQKTINLIEGIVKGCKMAGCALLGGETAEMPDFYPPGEYDLAGFAVGIVDKKKIIDGKNIQEGNRIIGLASSGLHSNGFSLVRKVLLENKKYQMSDKIGGLQNTLGEELLKPTKIYVKEILDLLKKFDILGIAHITGGGLIENIPRILPEGLSVEIDASSWQRPLVFSLIQKDGNIAKQEMYRTFNMGIGMVLIVPESESEKMLVELESMNCESYIMGQVIKGNKKTIIK